MSRLLLGEGVSGRENDKVNTTTTIMQVISINFGNNDLLAALTHHDKIYANHNLSEITVLRAVML